MDDPILSKQPADPGTPRSRTIAVLGAVVLSLAVILLQNVPPVVEFFGGAEVAESVTPDVVPPQLGDPPNTLGRMFIKMSDLVSQDPQSMPTLDRFCVTDADRLRSAVVAGELVGDDDAADRLGALVSELGEADPIGRDAADLLPIYTEGTGEESPGRDLVDDGAEERLRAHHGYYADVALTRGLPDDHPDRAPLLRGGAALMMVAIGMMLVLGLALVGGFVLLVVGIVLAATGRLRSRMARPERGGSVLLEVYVLFVGGFLLLQLVMWGLGKTLPAGAPMTTIAIGLQWLLLGVVMWPRLRGMSGEAHARAMGWHSGTGFLKEVGFGVVGYLAGLPVYLVGTVMTFVAMVVAEIVRAQFVEGPPPVPSGDLFELVGGTNPIELVLFMSLAVVWAPLCEESVFRGALYRHFRGRLAVPLAALGSAALFGFMHGYGPLFVFPLIALGSVFAVMREWRGSLIAPITAHMLHNGTVTVLLLVMIRVLA